MPLMFYVIDAAMPHERYDASDAAERAMREAMMPRHGGHDEER